MSEQPTLDVAVTVTLEAAIAALADARMFRAADLGAGHGAAARIKVRAGLAPDLARKMHRLLGGSYRTELGRLGIDFDTITVPAGAGTAGGGHGAPAPARAQKPIGRTRVWVTERGLWMKSPFEAKDLVREQIPAAKWQKSQIAYLLPATPQAALSIANALGQHGVDADEAATALVLQGHEAKAAQAKRVALDLPNPPGSKTQAWAHQRQAFWFARELPGVILDMEMGTGKSKVVADLIHDSGAMATMIVCPERVVGVWPKQFGIHCGGDKHIIDPRRINRRGEWKLIPIADRVDLYEHALHECRCGLPHVLMTNYAASAHEPFKSWSLAQHFDYLAYDECHRIRTASGVWSKWAKSMYSRADRRLGGTGTLQAQTPLDVFGQVRAVEPGIFGDTYTAFEKRYAIKGGYEGKKVVDYQNEDELAFKLSQVVYRAGEEVLDLPKMMPDTNVVGHLSPKAWKAYSDVENDMYAEFKREMADGTFEFDEASADNVLVKILRCMQMTGGHLQLDSGILEKIDTAKSDLLADELEDIGPDEQVVIFAKFIPDLDRIAKVAEQLDGKRGRPYRELSGRRSDALTADATLHPEARIAGVQIQAGGTGVDFTAAAFGYYYSVGYSLGDYLQSRKRLHRPGQERSVRFRHLVMEGTIDETVYAALAARENVVQRIADKVRGLQAGGAVLL